MKRHRCLSDVPPFFRTRAASYVDSDTAQIIFITFFFLLRRHALFMPFMLECLVRPVLGSHTEWNSNGTCPAMRESEMAVCVPSCEGSSLSSRVALARTDMYVSFLTTPPRDALFRSASCSVSLSDAVAPVASFGRHQASIHTRPQDALRGVMDRRSRARRTAHTSDRRASTPQDRCPTRPPTQHPHPPPPPTPALSPRRTHATTILSTADRQGRPARVDVPKQAYTDVAPTHGWLPRLLEAPASTRDLKR